MSGDRAVLVLQPSDEAYGSDRVVLRLAIGLRARGWRIRVLLSDDRPPGWLSEQLSQESIDLRRGPLAPARRQLLRPLALPGYARALVRARRWVRSEAREFRPSVIHVNTTALLVAAILGHPSKSRVVWHVHELVVRPRPMSWLFRIAPTLTADRVVAISRAVRDHVSPRGLRRNRVSVVWNGVNERPLRPGRDARRPLVAFIGRLNRWKGWEIFVDAIGHIAARSLHARFLIAGDPPPGEEWRMTALQGRITALGLQERIEVRGFERDVPVLLDEASVVVVPSAWPEPFGLVTLEAMRAGCAVIATGHGGALDLIEPGVSGLLIPPGDATALGVAIESLLADPDLCTRLGQAAIERARTHFSEEAFLDGMEDAYHRATAGPTVRPR